MSSVVDGVFDGLSIGGQGARRAGETFAVWRKVLLGIRSSSNPNEGANLADHSRVVDLKNGVLLVEADHPGWIELLQLRKNFILNGLSMYAKGMGVQTLAFRLAGKRGNVTGDAYSTEEARGLAERRLAREESALAKADLLARPAPSGSRSGGGAGREPSLSPGHSPALAPELEAALSALKRDMGV